MPIDDAPGSRPTEEGRKAHDHDGDEEGVFASDEIADAAEHQRAERAHQEARGESEQREQVAGRFRILREEVGADQRRQRSVEIEIVPLEDRAQRRSEDHLPFLASHSTPFGARCCCHCHFVLPDAQMPVVPNDFQDPKDQESAPTMREA